MGINQGKGSILCQSRSIKRLFFVVGFFGVSTIIIVTKGLYSSNTFFCKPKHRYPMGLNIPKDLITFGNQTSCKLLELEGELRGKIEGGTQQCQEIFHIFHHLKVIESLDNKISLICHAMDAHHEGCMIVDKLHYNIGFCILKNKNHICPECDQPLLDFLIG